ncbi:MAG: type II secretion system minor pseudopilin GspH [Woeseiaceae bacterium]|jgi:general secretion pathway protein H
MSFRSRTHGFTLIEILVVIVIIATVVSIALLSVNVGGDDAELLKERRRLASLMETVQDEAMLQGREFGVELMTSGYRFVEFDPLTRQWSEIYGDDLYRLRELPDGIEFELFVDDRRVELKDNPKTLSDPDRPMVRQNNPYSPHLYIFASGEATVFTLNFWRRQTDRRLILRGDVLGDLEFGERDDDV